MTLCERPRCSRVNTAIFARVNLNPRNRVTEASAGTLSILLRRMSGNVIVSTLGTGSGKRYRLRSRIKSTGKSLPLRFVRAYPSLAQKRLRKNLERYLLFRPLPPSRRRLPSNLPPFFRRQLLSPSPPSLQAPPPSQSCRRRPNRVLGFGLWSGRSCACQNGDRLEGAGVEVAGTFGFA